MSAVITVESLSKRYLISHRPAQHVYLRDAMTHAVKSSLATLRNWAAGQRSDSGASQEEFWALREVSFAVEQGARMGIIGRNGAGKSTLLKILSRITEPTTGRVTIDGRVASLLEVGTGFHPELTGRENVFLNGAILGMSRIEIASKFDEIVAFAEIEKFIDTPVKRYSSGMYVRLAFAVAAHLEPEILIVDEVLAVGDMTFQRKCLGKMEDVSKSGRTVLFVSHNLATISALCDQAILISQGSVVAAGDTADVVAQYVQQQSHDDISSAYRAVLGPPGSAKAELAEVDVFDDRGRSKAILLVDEGIRIRVRWRLNVDVPFLRLGVEIVDQSGVIVLATMDTDSTDLNGKPRSQGIYVEEVEIPRFLLMPGFYTVKVFAGIPRVERIMEMSHAVGFEVLENDTHLSHVTAAKRDGYIATPLAWRVERALA